MPINLNEKENRDVLSVLVLEFIPALVRIGSLNIKKRNFFFMSKRFYDILKFLIRSSPRARSKFSPVADLVKLISKKHEKRSDIEKSTLFLLVCIQKKVIGSVFFELLLSYNDLKDKRFLEGDEVAGERYKNYLDAVTTILEEAELPDVEFDVDTLV